jgi:hypothetical protein
MGVWGLTIMDAKNGSDLSAVEPARKAAKARRRATDAPKLPKRSLNLRVDEDCYERLSVHAMKRRTTISALVEQFAREHLRDYYISRNSRAGEGNGDQGET